jgi:hypothetical protein
MYVGNDDVKGDMWDVLIYVFGYRVEAVNDDSECKCKLTRRYPTLRPKRKRTVFPRRRTTTTTMKTFVQIIMRRNSTSARSLSTCIHFTRKLSLANPAPLLVNQRRDETTVSVSVISIEYLTEGLADGAGTPREVQERGHPQAK